MLAKMMSFLQLAAEKKDAIFGTAETNFWTLLIVTGL